MLQSADTFYTTGSGLEVTTDHEQLITDF